MALGWHTGTLQLFSSLMFPIVDRQNFPGSMMLAQRLHCCLYPFSLKPVCIDLMTALQRDLCVTQKGFVCCFKILRKRHLPSDQLRV